MNKKGFTLIELLGVIIILGILAAIGTVSYYKYLDKAKSKSFVMAEKTLMNNAKNAYADCFSDSNNDFCKIYDEYGSGETIYITLSELINYGYSDKIKNPYDTSSYCDINNSYVTVDDNGVVGNNKDISYQVCLVCGEHKSENTCDGVVDTKRKDTINFAAKTATYTGNPIVANKATATSKSEITYTYYSSTNCSGTALSGAPTDVGNYSVKATSVGNDYYKSESKCVTHTIKKDSDAYLSSLSITNYSISPSFSALKENYTVTTEAANVIINATAESKFSTIIGTGPQNLNWGSNTKSVLVTAQDGTTKTYKITINNKRPVAPILYLHDPEWTDSAAVTVNSGSALSGLTGYEYYISSSSTAPTNANLSNGVESIGTKETGSTGAQAAGVRVETEGISYVWFRSVSTNDFRSVWAGPKITKIDTEKPTVTVALSGKNATLTLSDKQGIVGYGVNQSATTQPTYTSVSGTNITKTWTAQTAGTYVAWVKDVAGRTANYEFTISSSAFCQYNINHEWTFAYTGREQQFSIPCTGKYKLEVWGAQGGYVYGVASGGSGGYSYGEYTTTRDTTLYIEVGGAGTGGKESYSGGYNGGGLSGKQTINTYDWQHGSGGGATHIALESGLLKNLSSNKSSILIVAGGGGGCGGWYWNDHGNCRGGDGGGGNDDTAAGGASGQATYNVAYRKIVCPAQTGATQSSGSSFGQGADANAISNGYCAKGGGGGGYYGGINSGTRATDAVTSTGCAGSGGSGYVSSILDNIGGSRGVNGKYENDSVSLNGTAKITLISIDQ